MQYQTVQSSDLARKPPKLCVDCNTAVRNPNAERCQSCRIKWRKANILPHRIKTCEDCGKLLKVRTYASKRCLGCANKCPERAAKIIATHKRKLQNPKIKAEAVARMRAARQRLTDPDIQARIKAARKKQAKSLSDTRLSWCPVEYRKLYRKLRNKNYKVKGTDTWKKVGAKLARKTIEEKFGGPIKQISVFTPELDYLGCQINGERIRLSPMQHRLLVILLLQHPDKYINMENLIERLWENPDNHIELPENNIRNHLMMLRKIGIPIVRAENYGLGYRIPREARGPKLKRKEYIYDRRKVRNQTNATTGQKSSLPRTENFKYPENLANMSI
jgi:DNA-binding winged helix-turn-helix (wHTH) protein